MRSNDLFEVIFIVIAGLFLLFLWELDVRTTENRKRIEKLEQQKTSQNQVEGREPQKPKEAD